MTRYRWDRALDRTLCSILKSLGFHKVAPLCFARKTSGCGQILNFGGRTRNGLFMFTCTVGIRFPEIESRLRPDNTDESYATVFTPFHFLYESRRFFEWEVKVPEELEAVARDAITEIMTVATPFFERFSDLDNVEKELKENRVSRELPLSPHQRIAVLAAIAMEDGRVKEAKATFSDAMSDPANKDPRARRLIEEIQDKLFRE